MMARDRHAPIVDAIERADVDTARQVVDEHMASAAERFSQAPETA
jgi:DNA-binding FadR family transcriptional regulator